MLGLCECHLRHGRRPFDTTVLYDTLYKAFAAPPAVPVHRSRSRVFSKGIKSSAMQDVQGRRKTFHPKPSLLYDSKVRGHRSNAALAEERRDITPPESLRATIDSAFETMSKSSDQQDQMADILKRLLNDLDTPQLLTFGRRVLAYLAKTNRSQHWQLIAEILEMDASRQLREANYQIFLKALLALQRFDDAATLIHEILEVQAKNERPSGIEQDAPLELGPANARLMSFIAHELIELGKFDRVLEFMHGVHSLGYEVLDGTLRHACVQIFRRVDNPVRFLNDLNTRFLDESSDVDIGFASTFGRSYLQWLLTSQHVEVIQVLRILETFQQMQWNVFVPQFEQILAFCMQKRAYETMIKIFQQFDAEGRSPSTRSVHLVMRALIKLHDLPGLLRVFDTYCSGKSVTNVETFNIIMDAFADIGDADTVERLFSQFCQFKGTPDDKMLASLMKVRSKRLELKETKFWFSKITDLKLSPNVVHYNILLRSYRLCGLVQSALHLYARMKESDTVNSRTFTEVMQIYHDAGEPDAIEDVIESMKDYNCYPDMFHFVSLMSAYNNNKQFDMPEKIIRRMRELQMQPTIAAWNCVLYSYVKTRQLIKFKNTISYLKTAGIPYNFHTYGIVLQNTLHNPRMDLRLKRSFFHSTLNRLPPNSQIVSLIWAQGARAGVFQGTNRFYIKHSFDRYHGGQQRPSHAAQAALIREYVKRGTAGAAAAQRLLKIMYARRVGIDLTQVEGSRQLLSPKVFGAFLATFTQYPDMIRPKSQRMRSILKNLRRLVSRRVVLKPDIGTLVSAMHAFASQREQATVLKLWRVVRTMCVRESLRPNGSQKLRSGNLAETRKCDISRPLSAVLSVLKERKDRLLLQSHWEAAKRLGFEFDRHVYNQKLQVLAGMGDFSGALHCLEELLSFKPPEMNIYSRGKADPTIRYPNARSIWTISRLMQKLSASRPGTAASRGYHEVLSSVSPETLNFIQRHADRAEKVASEHSWPDPMIRPRDLARSKRVRPSASKRKRSFIRRQRQSLPSQRRMADSNEWHEAVMQKG